MKSPWILFLALPLFGQIVPGRYIVELTGEPAAVAASRSPLNQRRGVIENRRAELRAVQQRVRAVIKAQSAEVVASVDTVANALIVQVPDSQAARLSSIPGVARVSPVRRLSPALDRVVTLHHVTEAWNRLPDPGAAGAGVKIGIIDSGIDPDHPGFQDATMEMPAGFPIPSARPTGFEGKNKIVVARSYEYMHAKVDNGPRDTEGHGTAVAMAAAGVCHQAPLAFICGTAPKAWLGVYRIPLYSDSILKAIDDAVADGMDILNLSVVEPAPYRPNTDPLYDAVERASAAGVIVVSSAGNEGPLLNSMSTPAIAPSVVAVGATPSDRQFVTAIQVRNGPAYSSFAGDSQWQVESATGPLFDVASVDPTGLGCGVLPADLLGGKIALILRGVCTFEDKINNAAAAGAIGAVIYNDEARADLFKMATGSASLPAQSLSYADGMSLKSRLNDDPNLTLTLSRTPVAMPMDPNKLADFSSAGPNPDDGIKPDLVAIGMEVYTAAQKSNSQGDVYDPSGYAAIDGTSFSSPVVAGSFAVLKSARPGLTAAQYRSLLINSATPLLTGEAVAPVQRGGAGLLNLDAAMRCTIAVAPVSVSFGVGGGTVESARSLNVTNLAAVADTLSVTVSPIGDGPVPALSQGAFLLDPGASAQIGLLFTAGKVPEGAYQGFILIRGTQSGVEARIPYWYAAASTVPANVRVVDKSSGGRSGATIMDAVVFQVTEASGVALPNANPKVMVVSGGGRVAGLYSYDSAIPGGYVVDVRLGTLPGDNVFRIDAGSVSQTFTITGN
jgi:subtilisin family serine protease